MSWKGTFIKAGIVPRPSGILEFIKPVTFAAGVNAGIGAGNVFYVDSNNGNDDNRGKSPSKPLATLDFAVGRCSASNGDTIYLLPGHTETLALATSCVIDVAGVSIIGLGNGEDRPTFTLSASASKINITAASVLIRNIKLISSFTGGVATGILAGAGADGLTLLDIEMRETTNAKEWLIGISITAACNYVTIDGFKYFGIAGGGTTQVIKFAGASDYSAVKNFLIYCDASGAAIDALTAISSWLTVGNGVIHNLDTGAGLTVSIKSDTTGFMHDLRLSGLHAATYPAGAAMAISEVYISNVIFKQGFYGIVQDT